jgi:hypothetical protein
MVRRRRLGNGEVRLRFGAAFCFFFTRTKERAKGQENLLLFLRRSVGWALPHSERGRKHADRASRTELAVEQSTYH